MKPNIRAPIKTNGQRRTKALFQSIEKQHEFMEMLFKKFNFSSLDNWLDILPYKIIQNGGGSLLSYYKEDFSALLLSIYPHYPWQFDKMKQSSNKYFESIENQRTWMDGLYQQLQFKSLNDWFNVLPAVIRKNKGFSLLQQYNNDMKLLLKSVYPNFCWDQPVLDTIEKQRDFMDNLFVEYKLKELEDFLNIPNNRITKNGGEGLIVEYKNMKNIVSAIYPNYPWYFNSLDYKPNEFFQSIHNQRAFMHQLYTLLKLNSLDDWLFISRLIYIKHRGEKLLEQYNDNIFNLLHTIYPDHPWDITQLQSSKLYSRSIARHREFMDHLYSKLNLRSLDEWDLITRSTFVKNDGELLLTFYHNNFSFLLRTIYPDHIWKFENEAVFVIKYLRKTSLNEGRKEALQKYFSSIENQRNFMQHLFNTLNFNVLDEWLDILPYRIEKNGGMYLLDHYNDDLRALLTAVYPNYPWCFDSMKLYTHRYFKSIHRQREFMQELYKKLKFRSFEDWIRLPIGKLTENGGNSLYYYHYDSNFEKMLTTIYPNYPWNIERMRMQRRKKFSELEDQQEFICELYAKLNFTSMKDWLNVRRSQIIKNGGEQLLLIYKSDIPLLLRTVYPNYPWEFGKFHFLPKKYFQSIENQREYLDHLTNKFNITNLSHWVNFSREEIEEGGGDRLLSIYHNDPKALLRAIYPNFPWRFEHVK